MKQTAVEWLVDEMIQRKFFEKETELSYTTLEHLTNQAKAMEKQNIVDAYRFGIQDEYVIGSQQYYNKTFKQD